jgi:hypothetical protein
MRIELELEVVARVLLRLEHVRRGGLELLFQVGHSPLLLAGSILP